MKFFMQYVWLVSILFSCSYSWEINTHRAIDRVAIDSADNKSINLHNFISDVQIENEIYEDISYEGYQLRNGTQATFFNYIESSLGEPNGVSNWEQSFENYGYQNLIEAGTILEDAVYADSWVAWNGRFNNHFYDSQNAGAPLTWGWGSRTDAISWAKGGEDSDNQYSLHEAIKSFRNGFSTANSEERRKARAKMFVSLGHILHMLNDMNVPAHTRDDSHPEGDPFEVWMRGGEQGDSFGGFKIIETDLSNNNTNIQSEARSATPYKYESFESNMKREAIFTGTHFFSKGTIFYKPWFRDAYSPKKAEVIQTPSTPLGNNVFKSYIESTSSDLVGHKKLAIAIDSYIIENLQTIVVNSTANDDLDTTMVFENDISVFEDNGFHLISRAVANAEGFVNYFFRGRLKAEVSSCGLFVKNISNPNLVADSSVVTFKQDGNITVYADKPDGNRTFILTQPLHRDLAVDEEILIPELGDKLWKNNFRDENASIPLTVVFNGNIGVDEGVAVAKTTANAPTLSKELTQGVVEVTLSWDRCYPMVDLDLETNWDAGVLEVHDDENSTFEYYVIEDDKSIYPGSYSFYGRDKTDHSLLDEEAMQEDPIDIYVFAKAPGTKKLYKVEATVPGQLDIGRLFDIDIREKEVVVYPSPDVTPVVSAPYRPVERGFDECAGNRSCGCIPCEYKIRGPLQEVTLGPISGAAVTVYRASDMNTPLFVGKTTEGRDIYTTGIIEIPPEEASIFDDEEIYIIKAQGGEDIDSNDDFTVDETPVKNNGTLHAIVTGKQLKELSLKVNILAEIAYQVSKDKLGDLSQKDELFAHLDDVAKRILKSKVFPIDGDYSIHYSDILLWLPTVDKKLLFKDYDTYVHPIVEKVYADSDYAQDAYKFVYESVTPGAPEIFGFAGQVDVNAPANSIIGALEIASEGASAITTIVLSGEGHENFSIDAKGVVRVAQGASFDMGAMPLYRLEAVAVNESGISSLGAEVIIEVADLPNAPYATSLEVSTLVENTPPGTLAGKIVFEDAESTVTSVQLTGEGSEDFTVNISGEIYVAEGAHIDYERQSAYPLEISATNAQGNSSLPVMVNIAVKDVFDTPAIQLVFVERVSEAAPIGHSIGTIDVLREGVGPVTGFTILGGDNIPFKIDSNGTVRVASYLNYEVKDEYSFMAVAQSDYGDSNRVYVNIIVDDAPEVGMPVLSDFTGSVSEDAVTGTVIGKLALQSGSSPVEAIVLSGMGSEYFTVANDGTITVSSAALLDYELFQTYDLKAFARNANGSSAEVDFHISVTNVQDMPPHVMETYVKVSEDAEPQSLIGQLLFEQGDAAVSSFELEGIGSDKFLVESNGTISLNAELDYEAVSRYQLNIVAHSSIGDSNIATINIVVEDVPDSPPVVYEFSGEVDENVVEHTLVGRVTFDEGSSPLNTFSLSGTGSELFAIDLDGVITVAAGALLDYEKTSTYSLYAVATNSYGSSQSVPVTIAIRDIPEVATLEPLFASVRDQAVAGTIVGYLPVQENGEPIIEMRLDGIGKEDFTIDVNGRVTVSEVANLDYTLQAEYFLSVQAVYAQDVSERVEVKIEVTPYMDTRHVDPFSDGSAIIIHPLDDERSLQGTMLTGTPLFSDESKFGKSIYHANNTGCNGLGISQHEGDFTMSAWVKPQQTIDLLQESTTGVAYYLSRNQSEVFHPNWVDGTKGQVTLGLSVGTNGIVVPEHKANLMTSLLTYNGAINAWDFVVVTVENRTPSLYINGVFVKKGKQAPFTTLHPNYLGGCGSLTAHRMYGFIDQVSIFNRVLSDEEILELYNMQ